MYLLVIIKEVNVEGMLAALLHAGGIDHRGPFVQSKINANPRLKSNLLF